MSNVSRKIGILCFIAFVASAATVLAAQYFITYAPSNEVPMTVNPTASPSPSPSPTPEPVSGTISLTVNGESSAFDIDVGQTVTLSAQLNPASAATITFYQNGVALSPTKVADASGVATYTIVNLPAGDYVFKATAESITVES